MHRSDATHVTVGGILLGVGGVALSILLPLAAAAKPHPWTAIWFLAPACGAALLAFTGLYVTVAVYTGWKLPRTAAERAFAPALRVTHSAVAEISGDKLNLTIALANDGRGDVRESLLNVIVPAYARSIHRIKRSGATHPDKGDFSETPESLVEDGEGSPLASTFWNGKISFPGRAVQYVYLQIWLASVPDLLPVRLSVTSADLEEPFSQTLALEVERATRETAAPSS